LTLVILSWYYCCMEFTNVKLLLNNLDEATKSLPVTVTRFGRPIFEIWPIDSKKPEVKLSLNLEEEDSKKVKQSLNLSPPEPQKEFTPSKNERCKVPFCFKDGVGMGKAWNETTGEPEELWMCEAHLKRSLRDQG